MNLVISALRAWRRLCILISRWGVLLAQNQIVDSDRKKKRRFH